MIIITINNAKIVYIYILICIIIILDRYMIYIYIMPINRGISQQLGMFDYQRKYLLNQHWFPFLSA